ncbi:ribonuclease Ecym_3416 [Eremothecium cymbalariae DBVPG|uniref:Endonuclease n=1 Tax=Eremothecium cymbalariae (strain CBS 270.75 / DBVPG 7215 / KCTC 17166 / NRRL Y-17582) TaxID=931890 RepID=G8JRY3_ERECY|nr:Hypothetical protein Ecym_3416 [Eremothecium cymbalariae DBVPG\
MSYKNIFTGVLGAGVLGSIFLKGSSNVPATPAPPPQLTDPVNVDPAKFFKYGFPGPTHDLENRQGFISCYDRRTRNPYWVVEHITAESLKLKNGNRKNVFFKEDEAIPEMFRARLRDYFRSGYDRGHLAPAADFKYSQNAMEESFYLSNVCPQLHDGFNAGYWMYLEQYCRRLAMKYGSLHIVSGPLYLPKKDPVDGKFRVTYEVIGNPPNVAVPTHFFKLLLADNGKLYAGAYVLPNEPIPQSAKLSEFEVPINALERSTGLQFLQKAKYERLPVEDGMIKLIAETVYD